MRVEGELKRLVIGELLATNINIGITKNNFNEILMCGKSDRLVIVTDAIYVLQKWCDGYENDRKFSDVDVELISDISINDHGSKIAVGVLGRGVIIYNYDSDNDYWDRCVDYINPPDIKTSDLFGYSLQYGPNDELYISAPNKQVNEFLNSGKIYICKESKKVMSGEDDNDLIDYTLEDCTIVTLNSSEWGNNRLGFKITRNCELVTAQGMTTTVVLAVNT